MPDRMMTSRERLEAMMNGPMQSGPKATDHYCPECGKQSVVASGSFRRCVTLGCGWAACVTYARPVGEVDRQP